MARTPARSVAGKEAEMPPRSKIAALQAMLDASQELRELSVAIPGDEEPLVFHYKPLTWVQKTRILSEATEYRQGTKVINGKEQPAVSVVLHADVYFKLALQTMLVNPPVPMTDTVLEGLSTEIGAQFETIIPSPLTSGDAVNVKKD